MIEYWAVIGLACLDDEFREALEKKKKSDRALQKFIKSEGFRLSRYEMGEVSRLIKIPEVIECMETIYLNSWEHGRSCWTGYIPEDDYNHPVAENGAVVFLPSLAQIASTKKLAAAKKRAAAKKSASSPKK